MSERFAIDTNIAIYAFVDDSRSGRARDLVGKGPYISVQLLNEFANVAGRQFGQPWPEVERALTLIANLATAIRPVDMAAHNMARELLTRYGFSFYDSLIVAVALIDRCDVFYSEDMQDGQLIDGRLTIRNPFGLSSR